MRHARGRLRARARSPRPPAPGALLAPLGDGAALMRAAGRVCDEPELRERLAAAGRRHAAGLHLAAHGGADLGRVRGGSSGHEGRHARSSRRTRASCCATRCRPRSPRTTSRWWCSTTPPTDSTAEVARGARRALRAPRGAPLLLPRDERRRCATVDGDAVLFMQPDCFLTPGFVDAARGARSTIPAWARWRPKLIRTEGPRAGPAARRDRHRRDGGGPAAQERAGRPRAPGARLRQRRRGVRRRRRRGALPPRGARGRGGRTARSSTRTWSRRGDSDADLAWRTRLLGWRCVYEPAAVAYHIRTLQPLDPRADAGVGPDGAVPQPLPDDRQERPAARARCATCRASSPTRCWRSASPCCASGTCCAATSRRRGCCRACCASGASSSGAGASAARRAIPYGLEPPV